MNGRRQLTAKEVSELAALDALGVLPTGEATELRQHEESGLVTAEIDAFREVAGRLGLTARQEDAPSGLKRRLMQAVESSEQAKVEGVLLQEPGLIISSASHMEWTKHELPGVWVKPLFVDKESGCATSLVRLEPGSVYPSHLHKEPEELFVIEGELVIHGQRMRPGDYCRAEPGTTHRTSYTSVGGVFLVKSSLHDEIFAHQP